MASGLRVMFVKLTGRNHRSNKDLDTIWHQSGNLTITNKTNHNAMNTKSKRLAGIFAVLPLFLVALAPNFADAEKGPQVVLDKVIQEGTNAYDVVFKVYAGSQDLSNAKLVVTSDTWEREAFVPDVNADSVTSTNQIRIIAEDPSTISAELVMIDPEVDFPNHENWDSNHSGVGNSNNSLRDDPDQSDFEKKTNTFRN